MIEDEKDKYLVTFRPSGKRGYIEAGRSVGEAALELGVDLENICGGRGVCGKCRVRIKEGLLGRHDIKTGVKGLSPLTDSERKRLTRQEKSDGYRLACQARIYDNITVFVPEESRVGKQIVRKAATERAVKLEPAVKKYYVEMKPASLEEPQGDWERLQAELKKRFGLDNLVIDYTVLLNLRKAMRLNDWKVTVTVWMNREVIKIEPGFVDKGYGLAVDIGTTTMVGYLCDLSGGEVAASDSMINPQVIYGADVMSRITYIMANDSGLERAHRAVIKAINQIARRATLQAGVKREDIVDVSVVGNTCMHHIFLSIDPSGLGQSPFTPAIHHSLDIKARDLGLKISPGAYVHVLPIEAGFVGADNVGVLIAEEPHKQNDIMLIIDIGTNGELVLGNRKRLISSSCATGPAFEGAQIKYGMCAAPEAIEKVKIDPVTKEVHFKVIGGADWDVDSGAVKAKGICGSGIVDAVAEMLKAGILQRSGRFNIDLGTPRLRRTEKGPEFVIAWANETAIGQDITLCQGDIRAVQLAKGAMYAGAKLMMCRLGVARLDKVVLAGAFGSYIDKESALTLGLFPDCPLEDIYSVGNAAGDGARLALLNMDKRSEADEIAREVEYIELAVEPDFATQFSQAMYFPHKKDEFPHLSELFQAKKNSEVKGMKTC